MKRALFLDLDNTIYPADSLADVLFTELFNLIDEELGQTDISSAEKAKRELTRRPFQQIADEFGFSEDLTEKGLRILRNAKVEVPVTPYKAYSQLREVPIDKYLVTKGFTKLQQSKVDMLNIAGDFKKVYIVDPDQSDLTKNDIFQRIMKDKGYAKEEVLVIGDDLESEIKAAQELGVETFLFDPEGRYTNENVTYHARDYKDVAEIVMK